MAKKKAAKLSSKLPLTDNGTLPKADVLERWAALPAGKTITMVAMPAGKGGSSYEEDSIRLTGSLKFIDAVLSNLKSLVRLDNTQTRLDITFTEQKAREGGQRRAGKYVVYLKLVEKVRTTRAKAATPVPAPAKPRAAKTKPPVAAPPATAKNIEDAHLALTRLGYSAAEAQRRLTAVTDVHGLSLTSEDYIKLALKHSK